MSNMFVVSVSSWYVMTPIFFPPDTPLTFMCCANFYENFSTAKLLLLLGCQQTNTAQQSLGLSATAVPVSAYGVGCVCVYTKLGEKLSPTTSRA